MDNNIKDYETSLRELAIRLIGDGAEVIESKILSGGRINITIKSRIKYQNDIYDVLFQNINSNVFMNPLLIDRNNRIIEEVLKENKDNEVFSEELVLYRDKKYNLDDTLILLFNEKTRKIEYWRGMNFIDGYTKDSISNSKEDLELLQKIGYAFGDYAG